jgi:5-methylthioadenosine/S-adenosylhomocysteine deaminase
VMKSGATCVNDGGMGDIDAIAEAFDAIGMRGIATQGGCADLHYADDDTAPRHDPGALAALEALGRRIDALHQRSNGLVRGWLNVTTDLNGSDAYWQQAKLLADSLGVGVSSHTCTVARQDALSMRVFGKRGLRRMIDLGVLGRNWMGIHMGFADADEVAALAATGASVVHCPATSMGSGKGIVANGAMLRLQAAGVTVALGSDSPQWGDMIQQMQLAFYGHKECTTDDRVMPADAVLAMATRDAARALLWDDRIGSIECGKDADLVLIDVDQLRYASLAHPLLGLLRAGHGGDVDTVIVRGRALVLGGRLLHLDEQELLHKARRAAASLGARLG